MTNQGNPVAVARFIKKNGREPKVGELLEERLKRYNGRIWPESGNRPHEYKGKKKLMEEIKKNN